MKTKRRKGVNGIILNEMMIRPCMLKGTTLLLVEKYFGTTFNNHEWWIKNARFILNFE